MTKLVWLAILTLTLMMAAAAACGDSGEPSGEPVVVGAVFDYSGDLAGYGQEMQKAAELAMEVVNEAGGVLGRPMEAYFVDGGTNPATSTAAATSLVTEEGVQVLLGPVISGATLSVAREVTIPHKRLHISAAATSSAMTTLEDDDYVFRAQMSNAVQGVALAQLAAERNYETAAVIFVDNPFGLDLSAVFTESFEAAGGRVIAQVPQVPGKASYAEEVAQALEGEPDVVVPMSYEGSLKVYLREIAEAGYAGEFLFAPPAKNQAIFDEVGVEAFEGSLGIEVSAPQNEATAAFASMYEEKYGEPPTAQLLGETFDIFILAALAIERAGTHEAEAVRDALRRVSNPPGKIVGPGDVEEALRLVREEEDVDYQGVVGSLNFDENGDVRSPIGVWTILNGRVAFTGWYQVP